MKTDPQQSKEKVKPGETTNLSVEFTAPPEAGNFCVFFRLVHGPDSIEFGDKVFIDIEI